MIFAKVDVTFPSHYRLLDIPEDRRAAAIGVWTLVLCYTRAQMLDGFCPFTAIKGIATNDIVELLVSAGLLVRAEQGGRPGVVLANYAKHNETKADIERRMAADCRRKSSVRTTFAGSDRNTPTPSDRSTPSASARTPRGVPRSESESESESEPERESESEASPSQAPALDRTRSPLPGEHRQLVAHFAAEFERLKGAKPVIGPKGGAGAKKLLQGRTLAEAKAIVDRALADPWTLDHAPDLSAIAARVNAFIGRRAWSPGPQGLVQPAGGSWKKAPGVQ